MDVLQEVMAPIAITTPDGKMTPKDNPTDDEVRQFLAAAKQKADEAGIPDEPFELDIAAEFDKAVDQALAGP